MQSDEKEGCVAASVSTLCAFLCHKMLCVTFLCACVCHIGFLMGRRVSVSLTNDNLVKPDKLIFRAFGIFF